MRKSWINSGSYYKQDRIYILSYKRIILSRLGSYVIIPTRSVTYLFNRFSLLIFENVRVRQSDRFRKFPEPVTLANSHIFKNSNENLLKKNVTSRVGMIT